MNQETADPAPCSLVGRRFEPGCACGRTGRFRRFFSRYQAALHRCRPCPGRLFPIRPTPGEGACKRGVSARGAGGVARRHAQGRVNRIWQSGGGVCAPTPRRCCALAGFARDGERAGYREIGGVEGVAALRGHAAREGWAFSRFRRRNAAGGRSAFCQFRVRFVTMSYNNKNGCHYDGSRSTSQPLPERAAALRSSQPGHVFIPI